jgi:hypothetical protein
VLMEVDSPGGERASAGSSLAMQVLEGLASTRRFSMLLMFLDAKQKALVKTVFVELRRLGARSPEAIAKAWEQV